MNAINIIMKTILQTFKHTMGILYLDKIVTNSAMKSLKMLFHYIQIRAISILISLKMINRLLDICRYWKKKRIQT